LKGSDLEEIFMMEGSSQSSAAVNGQFPDQAPATQSAPSAPA
jgi:hypothetical protein